MFTSMYIMYLIVQTHANLIYISIIIYTSKQQITSTPKSVFLVSTSIRYFILLSYTTLAIQSADRIIHTYTSVYEVFRTGYEPKLLKIDIRQLLLKTNRRLTSPSVFLYCRNFIDPTTRSDQKIRTIIR